VTRLAPILALVALAPSAHAAPCTRAHHVEADAVAPCTLDGLPAATLDALLTAQDLSRRLAVELARTEARAAAAAAEAGERLAAADAAGDARVAAADRQRLAQLAAAAVHVAALEGQLRYATRPDEHWTLWRYVGAVLAAVAAVAAGVPCARGEAGWCAVSGAGVGVGVTLAVF